MRASRDCQSSKLRIDHEGAHDDEERFIGVLGTAIDTVDIREGRRQNSWHNGLGVSVRQLIKAPLVTVFGLIIFLFKMYDTAGIPIPTMHRDRSQRAHLHN